MKTHAHHIIYCTTCLVTGKWYIGMHSTDDMNDGYLGSGTLLQRSINKHGQHQHSRVILEEVSSREALIERERAIVSEALLQDPLCMNLTAGGRGCAPGTSREENTSLRMSESQKSLNMNETWRKNRLDKQRARMKSPDIRCKMAESQTTTQNLPEIKAVRSRACTVDGITIYSSIKALGIALGRGKQGTRSSNFRFVEPQGPQKNVLAALSAWADPVKKAKRLELLKRTAQLKKEKLS